LRCGLTGQSRDADGLDPRRPVPGDLLGGAVEAGHGLVEQAGAAGHHLVPAVGRDEQSARRELPCQAGCVLGRDEGIAVAARDQHRAVGLAIDERTSFPRWDGTPPDYHHIVHVLATKYPTPAE
jgi:hypothetical protein